MRAAKCLPRWSTMGLATACRTSGGHGVGPGIRRLVMVSLPTLWRHDTVPKLCRSRLCERCLKSGAATRRPSSKVLPWAKLSAHQTMVTEKSLPANLEVLPVTPELWRDLEALFGEKGAYGGCWCMWWRLKRAEFARQTGPANKDALKRIVDGGEVPGLLAYAGGPPIAWCSVEAREGVPALDRGRA